MPSSKKGSIPYSGGTRARVYVWLISQVLSQTVTLKLVARHLGTRSGLREGGLYKSFWLRRWSCSSIAIGTTSTIKTPFLQSLRFQASKLATSVFTTTTPRALRESPMRGYPKSVLPNNCLEYLAERRLTERIWHIACSEYSISTCP